MAQDVKLSHVKLSQKSLKELLSQKWSNQEEEIEIKIETMNKTKFNQEEEEEEIELKTLQIRYAEIY